MKKFFKQINKKQVAITCTYLFVLIVLSRASIGQIIYPFCSAYAFAAVFAGINPIFISVFTFLGLIIQNINFAGLVNAALTSALIIIFGIIKRAKPSIKTWVMIFFVVFSRVANIYFMFHSLTSVLWSVFGTILCSVMAYFYYRTIIAAETRGLKNFTTAEKWFGTICALSVCMGLENLSFFGISITKFIYCIVIMVAALTINLWAIIVAFIFSLSHAVSFFTLVVAQPMLIACVLILLKNCGRFLPISAVCLLDSLLGLISGGTILSLVPVLAAGIIVLCLPKKWLKNIEVYFATTKPILATYISGRHQQELRQKLVEMSVLFEKMQKCYRNMLSYKGNEQAVAEYLCSEVKQNVCENCANKATCFMQNDMTDSLCSLINKAILKGKVNFLDVNNLLSSYCTKINVLISTINSVTADYTSYQQKSEQETEAKANICMQLGGTSKIFKKLSANFCENLRINTKKSRQIKDNILAFNIACKECMVIENADGVKEIAIIVPSADAVNPLLCEACQKAYPMRFSRQENYQLRIAGLSMVSFKPQDRYEILCGYAATSKNMGDVSGDNYIYTRISQNKFLVAICDGMGHGASANEISSVAVNLIESYYKCGLDSLTVVDSVNSMLIPANSSAFSTLDATVVDLSCGQVDFIKIGSSISIIKSQQTSEIISVESLPLGVIDKIKPTTECKVLGAGDVVVLVSDGIADVFACPQEFCNFVNNLSCINMQIFAETILEEARARQTEVKDDMTVIAYKLVQKS